MTRIGIDPGVNTGYAVIIDGDYIDMGTSNIVKIMAKVLSYCIDTKDVILYIENPFKWTGKKNNGKTVIEKGKEQGVGYVKAHYRIWEDFCKMYDIKYISIAPSQVGSMFDNEVMFRQATQWPKKEAIHARDASKMVYQFYKYKRPKIIKTNSAQ